MAGIFIRNDGRYLCVYCMACKHLHGAIPITNDEKQPDKWLWVEVSKTLYPSVRHYKYEGGYDEHGRGVGRQLTECHYNITSGKMQYHADNPHAYKDPNTLLDIVLPDATVWSFAQLGTEQDEYREV